jgi:hypothetical protein
MKKKIYREKLMKLENDKKSKVLSKIESKDKMLEEIKKA